MHGADNSKHDNKQGTRKGKGKLMAMWINVDDVELRACEGKIVLGAIGFLLSVNYLDTGGSRHYLRDAPARALRSREPKLTGDCGTSNNVLTYAHGLHAIVGVNASYSRVLVSKVATEQACEWLEREGWDDLAARADDR